MSNRPEFTYKCQLKPAFFACGRLIFPIRNAIRKLRFENGKHNWSRDWDDSIQYSRISRRLLWQLKLLRNIVSCRATQRKSQAKANGSRRDGQNVSQRINVLFRSCFFTSCNWAIKDCTVRFHFVYKFFSPFDAYELGGSPVVGCTVLKLPPDHISLSFLWFHYHFLKEDSLCPD